MSWESLSQYLLPAINYHAMHKKLLVIQVAALGWELLRRHGKAAIAGLKFQPAGGVFPALTCSAQAAFRTAQPAAVHGMIANGLYFRPLHRTMFWEQSASLVEGSRIWDNFRSRGGKVSLLFWQQSLGENADCILSPAPIHKHHGGMIQDCYSQPADLYPRLCRTIGRQFNLMHYWGPLAGAKVGEWIAEATCRVLAVAPQNHLCLTYLPSLDYDLQRHPQDHPKNVKALQRIGQQLEIVCSAARRNEYEIIVFGDYAIVDTAVGDAAVFPNRALRQAGLLATRNVRGMVYSDFHAGKAMAMADHEIAHVYVKDSADIPRVRRVLEALPGVGQVLDRAAQAAAGIGHPNCGEFVLLAEPRRWMAYPWWQEDERGPDYAAHIDIHNKCGYDPCELFFGWPPGTVSRNTSRVRGSHGLVGPAGRSPGRRALNRRGRS